MKINVPSKSKKVSEALVRGLGKKEVKEGIDLSALTQKIFERQKQNLEDKE